MLLATVGLVGLFLMILTNLFHVPRTDLVPTFLHLHYLEDSEEWLLLPRNGVGHSNVGTFLAANAWSFKMLRRTSKATLGSPSLLDDVHTSKGQAYWLRFAGEAIGEAQGASEERILGALVRESNVYTKDPNSIWRILAAMITPSNRGQDDKFRKVFVRMSHLKKLADPEFASKVKVERPCDIQKIAHAHYLALELAAQIEKYGEDPDKTETRNFPGFWIGFIELAPYEFTSAPYFGLPEDLKNFDPKNLAAYINS